MATKLRWIIAGNTQGCTYAHCAKCRELFCYGQMLRCDTHFSGKVFCKSCAQKLDDRA